MEEIITGKESTPATVDADIENAKKLIEVSKQFIEEFKLEESEQKADFIVVANELAQRKESEVLNYLKNYNEEEQELIKEMIKFFKEKMGY